MNTAAARKFDDTAPLQSATRLRVVTFVGYAANDEIYDAGTIQTRPLPTPLPQAGEGANVARGSAQTLEDANGNRLQQTENVTGTDETTSYAFDTNDRLTTVTYPDKQTAYTFDNNANRLTEVTTESGVTTLDKVYTYNTRNQLTNVADSLNPANSSVYGFDANGNQTSKTQNGSTTHFSYDVKDQLLSVNQNNANIGVFSYDYQGHRIVKDMGGSIVRYAYDGSSVLVETDTSGTTLAKFDYGPDRLLSMNHATEGRAYYLFDALGSVANLTNTAGGIQARYQYDAFGNYRSQAGASFNRFAFTGHEKDNETNLYYFKARFYDPETGRFLNQDEYLGDINTPPSLHRYLYAYGNPTVYVDLNGYSSSSTDFDNAADSCESDMCRGVMAVGKAFWVVGTLGFATVHDPVKDAYDEGKITGNQYAVGVVGGLAVAGVNVAATVMSAGTATSATAAVGSTVVSRLISSAATGASIALADDSIAQATHVNAGVQDSYSPKQAAVTTAVGAVAGVAVGAVVEGAGAVSNRIANAEQAVQNVRVGEGDGLKPVNMGPPVEQTTVPAEVSVGTESAAGNNAAHSSHQYELLKRDLLRQEVANPGELMSGPVVLLDPVAGASPYQVQQIRQYADIANLAKDEGYLSSTGRVSTKGQLRTEASAAARKEWVAAQAEGRSYVGVVGHGPDTTWTGRPVSPFWLDMDSSINSSLGRQAQDYPIGYKPTRFIYEKDLK